MTTMVSIQHRFDGFDLDVDFEAPEGLTVLFGRSGSGKTSVINAVAGLLQPQQGRIKIADTLLLDSAQGICLPTHKRRIGYIFQEDRLFPHLTVRQNLSYGQRGARAKRATQMDPIVEMLGLGALLNRFPAKLSGGEKKRVAIGRALLSEPDLLLADEPLSGLDEARRAEILPYFERLRDAQRVPILYVSHAAAEVARLATTVVVLDKGRVVRSGAPDAIFADPTLLPAGIREAGALITARVVAHHDDGLTELSAGGIPLFLPKVPQAEGRRLRVRIAAKDVILSGEKPVALSALNIFAGTVSHVHIGEGPGALVSLHTAAGTVLARITRRSLAQMALREGAPCYAIVKTVSIAREDVGGGD